MVNLLLDHRVHDSFWTQSVDTPTTTGTDVTVGDTGHEDGPAQPLAARSERESGHDNYSLMSISHLT